MKASTSLRVQSYQGGQSLIMKQLRELLLLKKFIFYGQVTVLFIDLAPVDKTSIT